MKVGEKYVIEIDRLYSGAFYPELAGIKGFNSLVFDENGLSKLKRLENVAKDIRQEAYNLGFEQATKQLKEECNRAREEGRQEGYELAFTGVKPHDGCEGCEYELCDGDPCTTCKGSYVDKYKPKVEKTVGMRKYDICCYEDNPADIFCITNLHKENGARLFDAISRDGMVIEDGHVALLERVGHIDSLDEWLQEG